MVYIELTFQNGASMTESRTNTSVECISEKAVAKLHYFHSSIVAAIVSKVSFSIITKPGAFLNNKK
jgi:hypothetical protein